MWKHTIGSLVAIGAGWFLVVPAACTSNGESSTGGGVFGIQRLTLTDDGTLGETGEALDAAQRVEFDLGELRGSRDFDFILKNVGDAPITDIRIASSIPAFTVSPASIDVLPPDSESSVVPLIRVGVLHGRSLEGVGPVAPLAMGDNRAEVTISGRTEDGGTPVDLGLTVVLVVHALLMDVDLFDGAAPADLLAYNGSTTAYGGCRSYQTIRAPRFVNAGNVPILVRSAYDDYPVRPALAEATINPGEGVAVTMSAYGWACAILDGGGTVTDFARLPVHDDGLVYMCFSPM